MSRILAVTLILLLLLFLLPLLFFPLHPSTDEVSEETEPATSPQTSIPPEGQRDSSTALQVLTDEGIVTLNMAQYLWRVVAAEMPATFPLEALKAQAIAARTYAFYKILHGPSSKHPDADLCSDSSCCSAYITPEQALAKWGINGTAYTAQIAAAISQTDGQAVLYNGQPIDAVFHSSSSGATEDAALVWGAQVPYLSSVTSPENEDSVPNYHSTVSITPDAFRDAITKEYPEADLSGAPESWIGSYQYSEAGKVLSVTIGGVSVTGKSIRSMFSLRSTAFQITPSADAITFFVTGYGHGVGMSQYGARSMAEAGKTCEEILTWYYTGTTVDPWALP